MNSLDSKLTEEQIREKIAEIDAEIELKKKLIQILSCSKLDQTYN